LLWQPTRAGGLLRQLYGIWILDFLGLLSGSFEILHAEFHVIYQELLLANKQLKDHDMVCFMDFLLCVNILCGHTSRFHKFTTLIQDIKDLLHQNWRVRIAHSLREGHNRVGC